MAGRDEELSFSLFRTEIKEEDSDGKDYEGHAHGRDSSGG